MCLFKRKLELINIKKLLQAYLIAQDPDYITVKERVSNLCANGVEPEGVASIDVAVETLRVAEHLVPTLQEQLK